MLVRKRKSCEGVVKITTIRVVKGCDSRGMACERGCDRVVDDFFDVFFFCEKQ